ncbi:hypothetical protein HMPREF9946_00244 [Acetobacteraceae bacterium AT-5844]|nr:hypothetical protein HMPREF9946_00244 [Acetobacteraceae bacterium AT-5844]
MNGAADRGPLFLRQVDPGQAVIQRGDHPALRACHAKDHVLADEERPRLARQAPDPPFPALARRLHRPVGDAGTATHGNQFQWRRPQPLPIPGEDFAPHGAARQQPTNHRDDADQHQSPEYAHRDEAAGQLVQGQIGRQPFRMLGIRQHLHGVIAGMRIGEDIGDAAPHRIRGLSGSERDVAGIDEQLAAAGAVLDPGRHDGLRRVANLPVRPERGRDKNKARNGQPQHHQQTECRQQAVADIAAGNPHLQRPVRKRRQRNGRRHDHSLHQFLSGAISPSEIRRTMHKPYESHRNSHQRLVISQTTDRGVMNISIFS